ncbi:MAG: protein kinase [Kofleriaceae bacterium]
MRQPVPFGKYLLLDRISVGGMAEVFKAKSYGVEGFEKIIAIKRILPSMGEDREFIKMFIDEAKIAGQLQHANICQIFELGRIEGAHFIAMEYIWGKDLLQIQNRLRKVHRSMPVDMACFMLAKVCEGLDYAHRKRDPMGRPLEIVHRDCSPQNVLVSYEGEVKVIDFGIAKAAMRNSRTMAGVLKGKFGYMSPEQVRGLPLDRRSDIFALGTMLYECLTSDRLFQGETDFSTLEKVRNVDIQRPSAINPEIPEEVERIILRALAKDTEDRYQWCGDMLADLQQYLMRQEVVFTAKTLSAWVKELFAPDVERERVALEAYKRIGRDGLIAGVPAAAAKIDVVEELGEAGQADDPTMLGGPSFDDVDPLAPNEVGPASGSPAALGAVRPGNEFGEEAPTEIFGEISEQDVAEETMDPAPPRGLPSMRPTVPNQPASTARPPSLGIAATTPMGAQTPRPAALMPQFGAADGRPVGTPPPAPVGSPAALFGNGGGPRGQAEPRLPGVPSVNGRPATPPAEAQRPAMVASAAPSAPTAFAISAPVASPPAWQGGAAPGPQAAQPPAHTLLGMAAPPGLTPNGAYLPGNGAAASAAPLPGMPAPPGNPGLPGGAPGPMQPLGGGASGPMQPGGAPMPGQPGGASGPMPGLPGGASGPMPGGAPGQPGMHGGPLSAALGPNPYGVAPYGVRQPGRPSPAVPMRPEGKRQAKGSSVVRDIAIGVSIAAAVLALFVVIKLTVLDSSEEPLAMGVVRVLTTGSGTLIVDDKTLGPFEAMREVPETPGAHQITVLGADGAKLCERSIELTAGAIEVVDCVGTAPDASVQATTPQDAGPSDATTATPDAQDAAAAAGGDPSKEPTGAVDPSKDSTGDDPAKDGTTPQVEPAKDGTTPQVEPAKDKTTPKVEPAKDKTTPKVEPAKDKTTPKVEPPKDPKRQPKVKPRTKPTPKDPDSDLPMV